MPADHLARQLFDRGDVRQVGCECGRRVGAGRVELGHERLGIIGRCAVMNGHVEILRVQRAGDDGADATGGARNQCDLIAVFRYRHRTTWSRFAL